MHVAYCWGSKYIPDIYHNIKQTNKLNKQKKKRKEMFLRNSPNNTAHTNPLWTLTVSVCIESKATRKTVKTKQWYNNSSFHICNVHQMESSCKVESIPTSDRLCILRSDRIFVVQCGRTCNSRPHCIGKWECNVVKLALVIWMHSFTLIFLWFIYQNVSNR